MKATLLIITLTGACFTTSYSQINQHHKNDLASNDLPTFKFNPTPGYTFTKPDYNIHDLALTGDRLVRTEQNVTPTEERMPCYKPAGVYSMRIVKPDSTVNHTLLIKKF